MADYNAISDTQLDPDAPLTSQLGYQFRDNPIAIAEVSNNAPYVQSNWHGFGGSSLVSSVIYDFAVDGLISSFETPNFVDGYEYGLLLDNLTGTVAGNAISIAAYGQTDAVFNTNVAVAVTNAVLGGPVLISQPRTATVEHFAYWGGVITSLYQPGKDAVTLNAYSGGAQKMLKARISVGSGTFNGGRVIMIRRKCII